MSSTSVPNAAHTHIKTIGILGGGQLGMMLAQAALPLGFRCVFLEDAPNCPASLYGNVYSTDQIEAFAGQADVFTLEFENTPVKTCQWLASLTNSNKHGMYPPPVALQVAQDRLKEKTLFTDLGIATVPFTAISSHEQLLKACSDFGLPLVLKTSRGGYDGKGQYVIHTPADADAAWSKLGAAVTGDGSLTQTPAPLIAEGFVDFEREVSIIAARDKNGQIKAYNLVENHHHHGVLAKTQAPATAACHLQDRAQHAIATLMHHLEYVGVMTLELFVTKDKQGQDVLLANEIAPRVHNSGHFSIEGAVTSQFENHIRAITGMPLGSTDNVHPAIMVNVLGEYPSLNEVLAIDGVHYHTYHKTERENRKIAHLTLMPSDVTHLDATLAQVVNVLPNKVGLG